MTIRRPFIVPRYPASATFTTSPVTMCPPIGAFSTPARFWNPVGVGPGHRVVTVTPVPLSSSSSASENESTKALVAK